MSATGRARRIVTAVATFFFVVGAGALAQQAPVPTPRPGEPAAQQGNGQGAAQGQPAQQQPQPVVTRQETFQDWVFNCLENPETKESRCSIAQQLADAESRQPVFLWRIVQDGKGGLIGIWQTAAGVLISRGITLDAGTEKPITIPFQTCATNHCQAIANLAADFVGTLEGTEKAVATIYTLQGQPVTLTLSTKGLREGLAALKQ